MLFEVRKHGPDYFVIGQIINDKHCESGVQIKKAI